MFEEFAEAVTKLVLEIAAMVGFGTIVIALAIGFGVLLHRGLKAFFGWLKRKK